MIGSNPGFEFVASPRLGGVVVRFEERSLPPVVREGEGGRELVLSREVKAATARRRITALVRGAVRFALAQRVTDLFLDPAGIPEQETLAPADLGELIAVNVRLAVFEYNERKQTPKEGWPALANVSFPTTLPAEFEAGVERGSVVGNEMNGARHLANTPGGEMTPELLFQAAKRAARGTKVDVSALLPAEMKKLGMGGILGVGQGSDAPPRLIVLEYKGAPKGEAPVVLVGKGITFDTGGLNLKPTSSIYEMHLDMAGGAAVIHAVIAAAKLRLKRHVVGLVPAAENMPSGSSYRPGDLLKTMSGLSIEVLNTDAEGRVVLADALAYAKRWRPRFVLDVATLTGAAMVGLGTRASGLLSPDDALASDLIALGEESGDLLWRLPLWPEHEEEVRGTFGDVANDGKTRYGGATNGAAFLWQFVKGKEGKEAYRWAHLDIAPRMTSIEADRLAKGATGEPLRLLVRAIERIQ